MDPPCDGRAEEVACTGDPEGQSSREVRHGGAFRANNCRGAEDQHHGLEEVGTRSSNIAYILPNCVEILDGVQQGSDILHLLLHHPQLVHHVLVRFGKTLLHAVPPGLLQVHDALLQLEDAPLLRGLVVVHLADQVAADLRSLGENTSADAQVEGDDRGAGAEAGEVVRVEEPQPHDSHAADGQGSGEEAANGARADPDLHRMGQHTAHRMGQTAGALHRHAHANASTDEVQGSPSDEARQSTPPGSNEHVPPCKEEEDTDDRSGPLQVDHDALGDELTNVHNLFVALVLQQHEVDKVAYSK
mmetsp:Transcript_95646/g.274610  ORF Transcript_95646/g.274610 Transcript_95646/m.274610 type:complete len:302 (+) Transcript_95646:1555-2460(+)